jgi:hypothetical protein
MCFKTLGVGAAKLGGLLQTLPQLQSSQTLTPYWICWVKRLVGRAAHTTAHSSCRAHFSFGPSKTGSLELHLRYGVGSLQAPNRSFSTMPLIYWQLAQV